MIVGSSSITESMVCNIVARNITQPMHVIAHEIYTAHVKPLEDALAKAAADKAVLVEALEQAEKVLDFADHLFRGVTPILEQTRAALARVKGEA